MAYSRLIIGIAVFIFATTVATALFQATREPDNDGRMKDSYGTRFYGCRAIFDTLRHLGLPAERTLTPPDQAAARATRRLAGNAVTLILWSPSPSMVAIEPEYLKHLRPWVENGGRLVIAQGRRWKINLPLAGKDYHATPLLELLGLKGLKTGLPEKKSKEIAEKPRAADAAGPAKKPKKTDRKNKHSGKRETTTEPGRPSKTFEFMGEEIESIDVAEALYGKVTQYVPEFSGAFTAYAGGVKKLALPAVPERFLKLGETTPAGTMKISLAGKKETIGAIYNIGKGEILIISDASLLFNRFFAQGDNALLGVALLGGRIEDDGLRPASAILFDEFYHGLNIQGNAWWLLARMPYNLIALTLLLAAGLWALRGALRLGPPVPLAAPVRRSLREYVEAMATLFRRADMRRYIFEEAYRGALWHLRRELKLNPRAEDPQSLANALSRKDPQRAQALLQACQRAELLLANRRLNRKDAVQVIRELSACCCPPQA